MKTTHALVAAASIATSFLVSDAYAEKIVSESRLEKAVSVMHEIQPDGDIQGFVRNNSEQKIKDVELLVKYSFVWSSPDQQKPDNPSMAEYVTLKTELSPGEFMPFEYALGRTLEARDDGTYIPSVRVVAMTPYESE